LQYALDAELSSKLTVPWSSALRRNDMSRINEALRRARDGRPVEPPAIGQHGLQEYPHELHSGTAGHPAHLDTPQADASGTSATLSVEIPLALTRHCQRIAAVLQERQAQSGVKTVAIASAAKGEGKTSTLLALALTLTRTSTNRVLLVDANLYHPTLHEAIRIRQGTGVSDIISGERHSVPPIVVHPSLHVLPAGRPSTQPAGDLGSETVRALLKQCASSYDWVLVDTPAMSLLRDDADVLGRLTDGVVFVVGAATPFTAAERAMATIGEGRILGTVLNGLAEAPVQP
jgi:Mrp family chromosome partitioning ATPase